MTIGDSLAEAYKSLRKIIDCESCPEVIAEECDTTCDALLRIMHEVAPGAYLESVAWDAGRHQLSGSE